MSRNLALFGLDGVLADDRHRRSHAEAGDLARYYSSDLLLLDKPLERGIRLLRSLTESGTPIGIISSRLELNRDATEEWLSAHDINPRMLILRPNFAAAIDHKLWKPLAYGILRQTGDYDKIVLYDDDLDIVNRIIDEQGSQTAYLFDWDLQ